MVVQECARCSSFQAVSPGWALAQQGGPGRALRGAGGAGRGAAPDGPLSAAEVHDGVSAHGLRGEDHVCHLQEGRLQEVGAGPELGGTRGSREGSEWGWVGFGAAAAPPPAAGPDPPRGRRCRSAVMEAQVFWRFVGTMMCVAAVFAVLVVCRQRVLDRKALEKVRKQIESI